MNSRTQDRLAALLSIMLLALLAGFTYYAAEIGERDAEAPYVASLVEPDYFVEGFSVTRLDATGRPSFAIAAERMEHFLAIDLVLLERPIATSLDPQRARITIRAERGRSDTRGEVTELEQAVRLVRQSASDGTALVVEAEQMTLDTVKNVARSEREVRITRNGSSLTGVGFELNNATRRLRLDSRVKAVLAPASKS
ncbi:MAG: LPS export ABC transporter periplasmic protein LptC [Burkholderiales bacterium]|nr:MAG: LPS export ABC transporter periplasmic protein LptC [Burkholderiales bacterium]